ncbi:hypothetical protein [Paenibacillus taichungensis]|uniref:hypothetical protein n=1 Tax=Paenibacillus taichungensis TaxID=484184 RepID=UPI0035E2ECF1
MTGQLNNEENYQLISLQRQIERLKNTADRMHIHLETKGRSPDVITSIQNVARTLKELDDQLKRTVQNSDSLKTVTYT